MFQNERRNKTIKNPEMSLEEAVKFTKELEEGGVTLADHFTAFQGGKR